MSKGKRIRRKSWRKNSWWTMSKSGDLIDSKGNVIDDWEEIRATGRVLKKIKKK